MIVQTDGENCVVIKHVSYLSQPEGVFLKREGVNKERKKYVQGMAACGDTKSTLKLRSTFV